MHGNQNHKTKVAKDQGTTPQWNEQFIFQLVDSDPTVLIKLYDDDFGKDDLLGNVRIDLHQVRNKGGVVQDWFPIVAENNKKISGNGSLLLVIEFLQ